MCGKARPGPLRSRGDLRIDRDHPRLPTISARDHPGGGRALCGRRLLVHSIDLLRQSRGRHCAQPDRHLFRHPAGRRAVVHRGGDRRARSVRPRFVPLAAGAPEAGYRRDALVSANRSRASANSHSIEQHLTTPRRRASRGADSVPNRSIRIGADRRRGRLGDQAGPREPSHDRRVIRWRRTAPAAAWRGRSTRGRCRRRRRRASAQ